MQYYFAVALFIIGCISVIAGMVFFVRYILNARSESETLNAELKKFSWEFVLKDEEIKKLSGKIKTIDDEYKGREQKTEERKNVEIFELKRQLQAKSDELISRLKAAEEEYKDRTQKLEELKNSEITELKRLLQEKSDELASKLRYVDEENKDRVQKVGELKGIEIEGLRLQVQARTKELAEKEEAANRAIAESERAQEQYRAALNKAREALAAEEGKNEKLSSELKRLSSIFKEYDENITKLQNAEYDIGRLEKLIENEKKTLHDMKMRVNESGMQVQLLHEKTKENVELIAQFAEGKEFEEFRKSIHIDEIVKKYEEEIRRLNIKNMAFEKRLRE